MDVTATTPASLPAASVNVEATTTAPMEGSASTGTGPPAAAATNEASDSDPSAQPAAAAKVAATANGLHFFFLDIRSALKLDGIGMEIAKIAVPAALALAADPLASIIDTAFIGRLGPVEIAAVGVSIAVFNQVSKVAIYPLVSVTTSFVAEEDAICNKSDSDEPLSPSGGNNNDEEKANCPPNGGTAEEAATRDNPDPSQGSLNGSRRPCGGGAMERLKARVFGERRRGGERRYIPSVSSALVVGAALGLIQCVLLGFSAKYALNIMGVKSDSPMLAPATKYLMLRSLGAPAVLLSLAMQGVFRGFKDTKTPLYATVTGDVANIILDPVLIFVLRLGVTGAAIAHVFSQYIITLLLLTRLARQVEVVPTSFKALQFGRFLRCGFLLLGRVIAVTFCVTLAASLAARGGPIPMAAFQICLQLWLATSLLADGLAVAGQAILASAFARGDHHKVVVATSRVLQLSVVMGVGLTVLIGVGVEFGSGVFTKDPIVIKLIHKALPFVAGTQTINSLAFVFDGVNFGASDYTYSAYSMVVVAIISIPSMFLLCSTHGYIGIWIALTIYMSLRTLAGLWRMGAAMGPWTFLRRGYLLSP